MSQNEDATIAALQRSFCAPRSRAAASPLPAAALDSPSLWNTSANQGWTACEEDTLCQALTKFGVGNWRAILDANCLPGKSPAQMYVQTQRILGQQSISEFTGLHVDCRAVGAANRAKTGVARKHRLITNAGRKIAKDELVRRVRENKEKFEVPESVWRAIKLPQVGTIARRIAEKKIQLNLLETELAQVRVKIAERRVKKLMLRILSSSNLKDQNGASSNTDGIDSDWDDGSGSDDLYLPRKSRRRCA
ncbi:hypothetical protein HDU83_007704 [Entophlyctis luteolus]|nr:hypothetical protein HDU83_007704 [Entophlyctis luteolus]KAJ3379729.1 hypothetical protein HDU84_006440 [Entophlyctis sp. JEL0112]